MTTQKQSTANVSGTEEKIVSLRQRLRDWLKTKKTRKLETQTNLIGALRKEIESRGKTIDAQRLMVMAMVARHGRHRIYGNSFMEDTLLLSKRAMDEVGNTWSLTISQNSGKTYVLTVKRPREAVKAVKKQRKQPKQG